MLILRHVHIGQHILLNKYEMRKVLIVIPIYKSIPDKFELISFDQCLKKMSNHPVRILTYKDLDIRFYEEKLKDFSIDYSREFFEQTYFESVDGYNRLMLNVNFYQRFIQYEYMLIYQLDAYVFRNELKYWCNSGYDYIGAPIPDSVIVGINEKHKVAFKTELEGNIQFFNGGFSLRRIKTFIDLIQKNEHIIQLYLANNFYEDIILGFLFFKENNFKLPINEEALRFSFDSFPALSYQLNNKKLPMGCHAWYRTDCDVYDGDFWIKRIMPVFYYSKRIKRKIKSFVQSR